MLYKSPRVTSQRIIHQCRLTNSLLGMAVVILRMKICIKAHQQEIEYATL